jgi:hypothetical protein
MNMKTTTLGLAASVCLVSNSFATSIIADFESSSATAAATAGGYFDGSNDSAANLNLGTSGGTWSGISTSTASGAVKVVSPARNWQNETLSNTGNMLVIGINPSSNDLTHVSTAQLTFDTAMTLAGTTLSMDLAQLGSGGQFGQTFIDLMDGGTVVARFAMGTDAGEGRGTINHYSAIGAGFYDNKTALGTENELWESSNQTVATVTLNLGATSFDLSTTGALVTNITTAGQGLSYVNGATTFDGIRLSSEQSKASMAVDNISVVAVPEPSSSALLGLGGLALILRRRK